MITKTPTNPRNGAGSLVKRIRWLAAMDEAEAISRQLRKGALDTPGRLDQLASELRQLARWRLDVDHLITLEPAGGVAMFAPLCDAPGLLRAMMER